jgi:hypothetical protein
VALSVAGFTAPALAAAFGAVTNNLASHLAERTVADLGHPGLARALGETAAHSQRFWQRAGQWVQHQRAHHLAALAANALGDAESAAHAGLVLLDTHDTAREETVDRAFFWSRSSRRRFQGRGQALTRPVRRRPARGRRRSSSPGKTRVCANRLPSVRRAMRCCAPAGHRRTDPTADLHRFQQRHYQRARNR